MDDRWHKALYGSPEGWEIASIDAPDVSEDSSDGIRFGTGGIRCLMGAGPNRMNRLTVGRAAQGVANWLKKRACGSELLVAIGHDTRVHSEEFATLVACVLAANDVRALLLRGAQPTPVLDYAVREHGCDAGVVITASHNPREYNGLKVYDSAGVQATDGMAAAIQSEIERVDPFESVRQIGYDEALASGAVTFSGERLLTEYREHVLEQRLGVDCSGLRVVYSPLNGTGLPYVTHVLSALNTRWSIVESQAQEDGTFPNCPKPNPENLRAMRPGMELLRNESADLFLATDPDADRVGVACMDNGSPRLLTGDEVGLLLLDFMCRYRVEAGAVPVAVTTIVSSPLADTIADGNSCELRRTLTGFKYVGEQIGEIESSGKEFLVGFEESDGYLRGGYVRDKDGINAAMLACELAAYYKSMGMTLADALEELYRRYGYVTGRQLTFPFPAEDGCRAMTTLMGALRERGPAALGRLAVVGVVDYLHGARMPVVGGTTQSRLPQADVLEWRLEGGSRVLVRPSGTEPKLKCYVFAMGVSQDDACRTLSDLCDGVTSVIQSFGFSGGDES